MTWLRFTLTLIAAALALPATAQPVQRQTPQSRAEITLSFAPTVKKAAPAVVNVYGARVEQQRNAMFDDPIFRRFFGDGAGQPRVARSLGSGVIADAKGYVVTNNHVIEGMTEVKVALNDKREFEADIVIRDPRTDLAVLRLKDAPNDLAAIEIGDSDALEVGDIVLAIGNPFGVGQTVTQGIVSALARSQVGVSDYQSFIQTDAAINPGNSGGALVDMAGRLVGINTAIFSRSGGSHGIGFAIPVGMVKVVVASAEAGAKTVRRPWLGARLDPVTNEIAESLNLPRPAGAIVVSAVKGGPAERAGLKSSDVIVAVDGQSIDTPESFGYRFGIKPLGGKASLSVIRAGKTIIVPVNLETAPQGPADATEITTRSPFQGATVATLSPALADELRLSTSRDGVVITGIAAGSPAQSIGLQPGDLILLVNGTPISSPADLDRASRERARLWRFQIERGGQVINSVIGG